MIYDLPLLSPAVNLDYLKELIKNDCKYFKVTRDSTHPLPVKNYRRKFDARKTLKVLETLLLRLNKKTTGFDPWAPPDLGWALRCICFLDPTQ